MSTVAESPQELAVTHGQGIALACFIGETRDRVVYVVEGRTTDWKLEGQTSIVFETLEEGEFPNQEAIARALQEELGIYDITAVESISEKGEFLLSAQRPGDIMVFAVKVFLVQLKVGTQIPAILEKGGELADRGIRQVAGLKGGTRPGTHLALRLALDSDLDNSVPFVVHVKNGQEVQIT